MTTYKINGKEIQGIPIKHNELMVYQTINELLKALSDKEEKCKWCKAGIPENCAEQSDLAETVARLDKQALKDSEVIEIPRPTYKSECLHNSVSNGYCGQCGKYFGGLNCTKCGEEVDRSQQFAHKCKSKEEDYLSGRQPKQSTSLKEEIIETIWMAHGQSAVVPNTSDKILSLIQSHLVKEIENLTQETVLDDLKREFPVLYKQDIIKIINNIIK